MTDLFTALDRVRDIAAQLRAAPAPLMEVLHAVQNELGYIPSESIPVIAEQLNLSRAEVHGVVTFYHWFRQTPPGKHIVRVCRAEACQARGGAQVEAAIKTKLGIDYNETSRDGQYSLEPVYCLGNCACGPSVMIDGEVRGNVSATNVDVALTPSLSMGEGRGEGVPIVTIFISCDTTSASLGANTIAQTLAREAHSRNLKINLIRTGSRGLFWLEPMIEVETPQGRIAYGPLANEDIASLFDAGFLSGNAHAKRIGVIDELPVFKRQTRVSFARVGIIDPLSIDDYIAHGGFTGLRKALAMPPGDIVQAVIDSGLRGRGGAAFPTGIKWKTVLEQIASQKYIACNADEGDSGTFADRMLMEGDPFMLIEGMIIAGRAVGATQGFIYLRAEYPSAQRVLEHAIDTLRSAGYLGTDFDVHLRMGAGAYICGEETSMLESLEGKRGEVRVRPPLPAIKGLFGMPTVVNNVLTFAAVPTIVDKGAAYYANLGAGKSRGTLPIQLAGNIKRGGLFELPFGITLRELLYDVGGGTASGRPIKAVQVGGPLGAYIPPSQFDVRIDYEALTNIGALLGHGGVVVFDDTVDMAKMARFAMEFCAAESCGKCTPCRVGSTRGVELIDRIVRNEDRAQQIEKLNELCETMLHGSLCGLGGMTPLPVRSALKYFSSDFLPRPHAPSPQA